MRKANYKDESLVVNILSKSFYKNKSVVYILKRNRSVPHLIPVLMHYSFKVGLRYGDIFISEDNLSCAIIMYPKRKKSFIYSTYQDIKLIFKVIGLRNINRVLTKENDIKMNHPDVDFAHLWYIGVAPENQGEGLGSHLLKEIIAYYKTNKMTIYLETSTERNIPFYQKLGFKVFNESSKYGFDFYYLKN